MLEYAANMEFEKAAETRDKIKELEKLCQQGLPFFDTKSYQKWSKKSVPNDQ